ncbi:D-tyrosyl-tRNA(Tyr) deacylase [Dyella dinghuensis]|uniref:D-aminoacyl-tRNA deacylase n=1 Tax=Dyella dinghuensis TaxID=1920169 RepID=A0A432LS53_9GAMM|nr:D-aminoacyl-tRNA deacylase [Dyella dinghuensis]RUL63130.1 D-tyrosyl-tRNA(Tyr) deacylase [Dyella dinghuensis]
MIALIQRVLSARVDVENETVGAIGPGLLALVAVQPDDGETQTKRMLERLLGYRVFSDDAGKMNRSLTDTGGGLLLVSQFTLAADTRSGMRPSFTSAAPPEHGRQWFERLVELAKKSHPTVEIGRFGAHMEVHLVNDGPVTFWLETR